MKMLRRLALVLLVTAASLSAQTPAGAPLPSVDEIIEKHIQATGGRAAWETLSTQTRKGIARPGSSDLPLESASVASGKWTVTIRMPNGRTLKHGFDGAQGWEERGRVSRIERDAILDETLIYNPFWPLIMRELFPAMSIKGIEKHGEGRVYVVEAIPAGGRPRTLFFDVRDGLLLRAGKTMYADYRDAGGVKVPFLVRYGFQVFQFSDIRLGAPVDEACLRMPAAPPPAPAPSGDSAKPREPLPSAGEVLDKYLSAIGGSQALARVKTRAAKGILKEDSESVPVETFAKSPGKWLMVLHTGAPSPDREGYNGASGGSESADVIKNMSPQQQPELESFLDFQFPLRLDGMRAVTTVRAKEKMGQREVYVLEAAPPQGRRRTLAFDTETGLLVLADTVLFEDYRAVGDLKLPFRVKLHGGEITSQFTQVAHDVAIGDERFEKPAPSAAFEKNFAGLNEPRTVAVLKRVIGQGVSPSDGRMLYDLIVERSYKCALDIGTAEGYAALWNGLGVRKNGGRVITIEIDPETADKARANFKEAGMDRFVDSRMNDALAEIPALKGDFDFVFMDTGAPLNARLFGLLQSRIAPGGAILAHNAASLKSHQPDFLKAIEGDPSLETKIVPTARGGILVAIKKK
jgi:predicted O-methyltransferase YrrM